MIQLYQPTIPLPLTCSYCLRPHDSIMEEAEYTQGAIKAARLKFLLVVKVKQTSEFEHRQEYHGLEAKSPKRRKEHNMSLNRRPILFKISSCTAFGVSQGKRFLLKQITSKFKH